MWSASLLLATVLLGGRDSFVSANAAAESSGSNTCCAALANVLGGKVAVKSTSGYTNSVESYWAKQETEIAPSCVVLATSAQDVSIAIKVLVPKCCKFAVRAGGHNAVPGIANINNGVTIDLRGLNALTPSNDKTTVELGPGLEWGGVYTQLDALGVSVPGGRDSGVGVGGSTLGGGFGYFAPKTGFAAENVVSYEVVLANGNIVTASASQNTNLFKALKGGSSNFGIVTKFTIKTFPLGQIWGGNIFYNASTLNANVQAMYDFTANPNYDVNAGYFLNYAFTPASGSIIGNRIAYAQPVVNPPAFQAITAIPQLQNTLQIIDLGSFANQSFQTAPVGFNQISFATTFNNNVQMYKDLWDIFTANVATIATVPNVTYSLTLEPIVPAIIAQTKAKGGNVLGLDHSIPAVGAVDCLLTATWVNDSNNNQMNQAAHLLLASIIANAKRLNVFNPYVDMNHADQIQDPISSYGAQNAAFLRQTARQVDPNGVFQHLMPGGFKL